MKISDTNPVDQTKSSAFLAYGATSVHHLQLMKRAGKLLKRSDLTDVQYQDASHSFPTAYSDTNHYVRVASFFFTLLAILCGLGWVGWASRTTDWVIPVSAALIIGAEVMIRQKNWYRNGIDNALIYTGLALFLAKVSGRSPLDFTAGVSTIVLLIAVIRYGDPALAISCFFAALVFVFAVLTSFHVHSLVIQIAAIVSAAIVTWLAASARRNTKWFYYNDALRLLNFSGLLVLYVTCNYLVFDKFVATAFYEVGGSAAEQSTRFSMPFGLIFAGLTCVIPLIYISVGIWLRDRLLWIAGAISIVGSLFTFRYYFDIMAIESVMTLAGIFCFGLGLFLVRLLHRSKHGFIYLPDGAKSSMWETFLFAHLANQGPSASGPTYTGGGGDFGGGGASGTF